MLHGAFAVGRVAGIEIRAHYTWGFAFVFGCVVHIARLVPGKRSGSRHSTTYALIGSATALPLFASALVHELSHTFVARASGQRVQGITLFVLDGFSSVDEPLAPTDEFLISIVGPLASFALTSVSWVIVQAFLTPRTPFGELVNYLALINLLLGAFNLLPCLPLDGGRVLRSLIWRWTRSPVRATRITTGVGQVAAIVFIGHGCSACIRWPRHDR